MPLRKVWYFENIARVAIRNGHPHVAAGSAQSSDDVADGRKKWTDAKADRCAADKYCGREMRAQTRLVTKPRISLRDRSARYRLKIEMLVSKVPGTYWELSCDETG